MKELLKNNSMNYISNNDRKEKKQRRMKSKTLVINHHTILTMKRMNYKFNKIRF